MEVTTQPVYIKDTEVNNITFNVLLEICFAINQQFPGEIYGAQKINNVWSIYVSNNRIRAALIVSGITVQGNRLDVHDDNPLRGESNKSERITIKDLPATLSPTNIMSFLRGFRQLNIKSKVIYAKERMGGDQMSPFINGDRLIYVHPNVSPPLPKETVISGHPCRIWHASQKNYCKRCATHGHRTMDIEECQSYNADCAVSAFRSNNNPLSNFYPCSIIHNGKTFISVEHFYQYQMCMYCNHQDAAEKVHAAPNAKAAKDIASDLKAKLTAPILAGWIKTRVSVMEETLKLKWNCCGKFCQALMATMGTTIAEATQDTFWGVGVAPNLAEETDPNHFLGFNQLSRILMSMRRYVAERELYKNNQEYELITAEDPSVASSQSPTGEVSNLIPSDESESSSKSSVVHDVSSSHTSENDDLTSAGNSDRLPVHTCANNPTIMTGDTTDLSAKLSLILVLKLATQMMCHHLQNRVWTWMMMSLTLHLNRNKPMNIPRRTRIHCHCLVPLYQPAKSQLQRNLRGSTIRSSSLQRQQRDGKQQTLQSLQVLLTILLSNRLSHPILRGSTVLVLYPYHHLRCS